MPHSNNTRKGKPRRKRAVSTKPTYRCTFCGRNRNVGHAPGCIGKLSEALIPTWR